MKPQDRSKTRRSWPKSFVLDRLEDESGVSGTGVVAEGVQFSDGVCVIHWLSRYRGTTVYQNITEIEQVHGHGGKTKIRFLEEK